MPPARWLHACDTMSACLTPGITAREIRWKLTPVPSPPAAGLRPVLSAALTLLRQRDRELRTLRWTLEQRREGAAAGPR